jgi:hypothetical protein
MERGCVGDQPQQFERAAADALRTAALRENFKSGHYTQIVLIDASGVVD